MLKMTFGLNSKVIEACTPFRGVKAELCVPLDSRRAVFHIGNSTYSSKLVDLPCVIEAQKTLDNKQMFKVADICQMLVVEDKIESEDSLSHSKAFRIDDFIWPHGLTPPLKHVRKRRFRKRVNRTVRISLHNIFTV